MVHSFHFITKTQIQNGEITKPNRIEQ